MGRGTLRTRTTLLATVIAGLTLLVGSVSLVLVLRAQLTVSGDALSRSRVDALLAQARAGSLPAAIDDVGDEGVAQVVGDDGRVVAASANIAGHGPMSRVDPGDQTVVRTISAPDDGETETYRVWLARGPSPGGPVTVHVGTSLESVAEATRTLRNTLLVGVPVALLVLAGSTWLVLGGALRRMDRIRAEVDEITEQHLDRRVTTTGTDDEVGRLAATMNRMLARIEDASLRQRAFVADASHDLQSPLAAQRAQLEVALAGGDRTDPALARDLLASTAQMERLVRDLLFVAGSDSGQPRPRPVPLDLDDVVLEEATRVRATTDVRIDTAGVSAAPTLGDRGELQRLVRNLLENAVRHARSDVRLTTGMQGDAVTLEVLDDGPGVPEGDRPRIFERFFRGDAARGHDDAGSGLGLAIARTIAERHGGELALLPSPTGARFALRLPGRH